MCPGVLMAAVLVACLAATASAQSPPPALLVAWEQSEGRGRRGRTWVSPPGRGVYASLLTPLPGDADLHTLPLLAGVGLCRAANRHLPDAGPRCRLKWPNDLLLLDQRGGRKRDLLGKLRGEGAAERRGLPAHDVRRVGVDCVDEPLHPGLAPAAQIAFEILRDDDDGARLFARSAMRLLYGEGLTGLGLPIPDEGLVELLVELACRIIGDIEEFGIGECRRGDKRR